MSNLKCPKCGLVNWASDEHCKRCKAPLQSLPEPTEEPGVKRMGYDVEPPKMFTYNGIGERLLGWRHGPEGRATATLWFTFLYLPIFPIARYELISPTSVDLEPRFSLMQLIQAFLPLKVLRTSYEFVAQVPISRKEVWTTYLYAYLWVPAKIYLPLWILLQLEDAFRPKTDDGSMWTGIIGISLMLTWLGYTLFVTGRLFNRARGGTR